MFDVKQLLWGKGMQQYKSAASWSIRWGHTFGGDKVDNRQTCVSLLPSSILSSITELV